MEQPTMDHQQIKQSLADLKYLERPLKFRPAGSPAGTWPHTPWWVCVMWDPYERVNVWSHGLPALMLVSMSLLALTGLFCACSALTHASSALTHVWPDDHVLEKIDHLAIPFTIVGTPLTAIMALRPEGPYAPLVGASIALLMAAFCRPLLRTLCFVAAGGVLAAAYSFILTPALATQLALYLLGAAAFIRNGGHGLPAGLQDHHFLHYAVTAAAGLHVAYIQHAVAARGR